MGSGLKSWSQSWSGRLVAMGLLVSTIILAAQVGLIMLGGGDWHHGFHLRHAGPRVLAALFTCSGWYLLRHGLHQGAREWGLCAVRLAMLLFSTVIALAAAEVGLRLYFMKLQRDQSLDRAEEIARHLKKETIRSSHPMAAIIRKSHDAKLVYELRPDLDMDFGHHRLRTNRHGFRADRDYQTDKPAGVVRIVGLGDSGMFGWGVEQGEEYLSVLESNLNVHATSSRYETLNLAVPGYNSQLEVQMLKSYGLAYKPDIVVVGWCDNDFSLPFFIPQEGQWFRRDISFLYYLLFNRSQFAEVALSTLNDQRQYDEAKVPETIRKGMDIQGVRNSFLELMALGREHGFKVVVMGPMGKEAPEIFREIGIPYYNTHERIGDTKYPEEYMVFFMHPTAPGHRVLAEYLEQDLRTRGWL